MTCTAQRLHEHPTVTRVGRLLIASLHPSFSDVRSAAVCGGTGAGRGAAPALPSSALLLLSFLPLKPRLSCFLLYKSPKPGLEPGETKP